MDWDSVFDEKYKSRGASQTILDRFIAKVGQPITPAEVREVNHRQSNPFPPTDPAHAKYGLLDPSVWVIPSGPLPPSYLDFLRWSNGGEFRTGARWFQFFGTPLVRHMMLAYHLPEYMPGALPFAFNGGGIFYLFDMRKAAVKGEYPVVCASAGALRWKRDQCKLVAKSFLAACRGTVDIGKLFYPD